MSQSDYDVHSEELALIDLYAEWNKLNSNNYGDQLIEPVIKLRRMARSQGFYKDVPRPSITINARLAVNNWPKTLDVLAYCMSQQAKAANGMKPDSPRQVRRMVDRNKGASVAAVGAPSPRAHAPRVSIAPKAEKASNGQLEPNKKPKIVKHTRITPEQIPKQDTRAVVSDTITLAIQIPRSELDALRRKAHETGDTEPVIVLKYKIE